ncbi:MAG TPA: carboxypeptidase regulatory-like domain-containing protein [Planctomycetota bacterium]|nr:carboxypeptidase regulatory-like domain-containing protein [Planctomycetota bacterium]
MGRSRLLYRGLIPLLLLAACGGSEDLLVARDITPIYAGGSGGGNYGPSGGGAPGKIVGKVHFTGAGWPKKKLDITTADGFCIKAHANGLYSEWFDLGEGGGLGNAVVYVKEGASGGKWDTPSQPVVLDQHGCQYLPHVAVLQVGQPLVIKSSDNTLHNVHMTGPAVPNGEFNQSMSRPGEIPGIIFRKPEVAQRVYCDVHSWMEAFIVVLPHPLHALTAEDGTFTIDNVPPGKYRLAAWQEKLGETGQDVTVPAGGTVTVDFALTR